MHNAEEFPGQRSGLARMRPAYRRPGRGAGGRAGTGRIRYAHHGAPPCDEPFGPVSQGPVGYRESDAGAQDIRDFAGDRNDAGDRNGAGAWNAADLGGGNGTGGADLGGNLGNGPGDGGGNLADLGGGNGADLGGGIWLAEFPPGKRHTDMWVLVCGGIAAAAAFAAAFFASGGAATHPASPETAVPAVVSQACPSPAAAPTP